MATRKPLVAGTGEELIDELPSGDTLSTADISDSANKRFVTDAEKASIGTGGGGAGLTAIQDTQPATKSLWVQTNVNGNPDDVMLWLVLEDL
jgi:hypothetical protein